MTVRRVEWAGDVARVLMTCAGAMVSVIVTLSPGLAVAQQTSDAGVRASGVNPDSRSGALAGQVVARDRGVPLRGAVVTLTTNDGQLRRSATTDAQGRFEVNKLPAAALLVTVNAEGFVASHWGDEGDVGRPRPILLAEGQRLDRVNFALFRGGVVTGRLIDEVGEPLEGIPVHAFVREFIRGKMRLTPSSQTPRVSDDRGRYRLFGLAPGDYVIAAVPGRIGVGERRGAQLSTYAPTYAPGTSDVGNASFVTVAAEQVLDAGDLAVIRSKTYEVSGMLLDTAGRQAAGVELLLMPGAEGTISLAATQVTSNGGAFTFKNVPPGSYLLQNRPAPGSPVGFAAGPVLVSDAPAHVILQARAGRTIKGTIRFEGEKGTFAGLDIRTRASDFARSPIVSTSKLVLREEGMFELRDVWGQGYLDVRTPARWALKTTFLGGRDVTDDPVDWDRLDPEDALDIVVTSNFAQVTGVVADGQGKPAAHCPIAIFATEEAKWASSRLFVQRVVTDEQGRYLASAMPPGSYELVAIDRIPAGQWLHPAFMETLRGKGALLTVSEGGRHEADLRLVSLRTFK